MHPGDVSHSTVRATVDHIDATVAQQQVSENVSGLLGVIVAQEQVSETILGLQLCPLHITISSELQPGGEPH